MALEKKLGLKVCSNYNFSKNYILNTFVGYYVGRICVVFSLPAQSLPIMFKDGAEIPKHLSYILPMLNGIPHFQIALNLITSFTKFRLRKRQMGLMFAASFL